WSQGEADFVGHGTDHPSLCREQQIRGRGAPNTKTTTVPKETLTANGNISGTNKRGKQRPKEHARLAVRFRGSWRDDNAHDVGSTPRASYAPPQGSVTSGLPYQVPAQIPYQNSVQSPQTSTYGSVEAGYIYDQANADRGRRGLAPHQGRDEGPSSHSAYTEDIFSNPMNKIVGTPGDTEILDPSYRLVNDRDGFFKSGRVFSMLYIENAGATAPPGAAGISLVQYGERAYAQIRRFIVVEPKKKQHWSKCICITTYGGRATTKPGVDPKEHAIIYSGNEIPSKLEGERGLNKDALRVQLVDMSQKLDPRSRVNFGRTFTIQHNVKVKEVGMLTSSDMHKLIWYWKEFH
ncbi:MAG: hypothetical protein M1830_010077, partial [Pleopsidium flavum]